MKRLCLESGAGAPSSLAFAAFSPLAVSPHVYIHRVVGVALRTMRNRGEVSCQSLAAQEIDTMGDQFEMVRPNAFAMRAAAFLNVIPFKALRRRTDKEMVSLGDSLADTELTIALFIKASKPKSTAIRSTRIDTGPKTFGCRLALHRKLNPFGVTGAGSSSYRAPLFYLNEACVKGSLSCRAP